MGAVAADGDGKCQAVASPGDEPSRSVTVKRREVGYGDRSELGEVVAGDTEAGVERRLAQGEEAIDRGVGQNLNRGAAATVAQIVASGEQTSGGIEDFSVVAVEQAGNVADGAAFEKVAPLLGDGAAAGSDGDLADYILALSVQRAGIYPHHVVDVGISDGIWKERRVCVEVQPAATAASDVHGPSVIVGGAGAIRAGLAMFAGVWQAGGMKKQLADQSFHDRRHQERKRAEAERKAPKKKVAESGKKSTESRVPGTE